MGMYCVFLGGSCQGQPRGNKLLDMYNVSRGMSGLPGDFWTCLTHPKTAVQLDG